MEDPRAQLVEVEGLAVVMHVEMGFRPGGAAGPK